MTNRRLVRVHPNFHVIAIGLAVPRYPGYPLDPPLRSRFQALAVSPISIEQKVGSMIQEFPMSSDLALSLVKFAETLRLVSNSAPKLSRRLPYFPDSALESNFNHLLQAHYCAITYSVDYTRLTFKKISSQLERRTANRSTMFPFELQLVQQIFLQMFLGAGQLCVQFGDPASTMINPGLIARMHRRFILFDCFFFFLNKLRGKSFLYVCFIFRTFFFFYCLSLLFQCMKIMYS
jgi:hypothetical protein